MFNTSDSQNYNDGLIKLFLKVSYKSSIAYITAISLYTLIFFEFIPNYIFWLIISVHVAYQIIRFYLIYKYKKITLTPSIKETFVFEHFILMLFGGTAWGVSTAFAIYYSPTPYEFAMLFVVVSMTAGSISTLSSIYRTYVAFNLPLVIFLTISFLLKEGDLNLYIALVIPIFAYVLFTASYEMHKNIKESMELKDLYLVAQQELEEINMSLENRISKAVEESSKKDKLMLEQSRLAQMGEMLSMIAHQWRQPLSAITSTTGSISLHLQLEKFNQEYVEKNIESINKYTQYLSSTINDFRDFFKPNKEKDNVVLNEIVENSLQIIEGLLGAKGVKIDLSLESKVSIYTYSNELRQVLLDLLKNAQDALVENKIKDPQIWLKTYDTKKSVVLEVSDNAGGIRDKNIKYIFDPYFTTKEKSGGSGLGLYMSKLIVEDHCNGNLHVENKNKGACFTIAIPLSENIS